MSKGIKCALVKCTVVVPRQHVFCEPHWKKLTQETRVRISEAWPPGSPLWLGAVQAALKELG